MAAAALRLAQRDLEQWVHTLGFRGHFVTKSRDYSTKLGTLRATRAAYRAGQDRRSDDADVNGDDSTVRAVHLAVARLRLPQPRRRTPGSPASRHPNGPPVKRCSTCATGHRKPGVQRRRA
jgi:hypothetical protein